MSFIITYNFVGSNEFTRGITIDVNAEVGSMIKKRTIPVELRSIKPPQDMNIDPLVLDCLTTEVFHSRAIMDHAVSLHASLPAWVTDYFTLNETKTLSRGRRPNLIVLKVFVQVTSNETNFTELLRNVDFKEISQRQKYLLGKLFAPFAHLPVINIFRYDNKGSSKISRPKRVGYYSIRVRSQNSVFFSDKSQIRYFCPPTNVNTVLNLKSNFRSRVRWSRAPTERHIVRWYWENGASMHSIDNAPGIITDSRTLATIMASPTNERDNWEIVACRFTDQIFMYEIDTSQRNNRVENQDMVQNLSSYAGYRFEQLVTRRYNGQTCTLLNGGLRDSFYSANVAHIGRHKLLYSARCAAVNHKDDVMSFIDDMEIVDIKTRAGKGAWESRVIALWVRAILNRVDQIYIGEKNAEFKVTSITSTSTHRLLPPTYNTGKLFDYLNKTLDFIVDTCKVEKGVYRFHRTPFLPLIVQKMDMPVESVLPRWYVQGEVPTP